MRFLVIRAKYIVFLAVAVMAVGYGGYVFLHHTVDVYNENRKEIPIYCVDTQENKIAVTFDCAWNADDIDSIIETLKKYNCPATFFVVGDWLERFPDSVKKLSDNGHEIANHSYNHAHYNNMTKEEMIADMQICDDKIEQITNVKPTLFRAPYGEYNDLLIKTCRETGRWYIQWSVDSLDWRDISAQEIYERCVKKTQSGDILLLHNGTPHTAEILPKILETLSEKYTFVKASDLIYKDNFTINIEGRQKENN